MDKNLIRSFANEFAVLETQYLIGYMGTRMQRLYRDIYVDIKHKNDVSHVFSNGYDLVQEGALFLCEHYGKHLSDVIGYTKKGKKITVQIACIKRMMKLINRKTSDHYRSVSLEALTPLYFFPPITSALEVVLPIPFALFANAVSVISLRVFSVKMCSNEAPVLLGPNGKRVFRLTPRPQEGGAKVDFPHFPYLRNMR